MQRRNSDYCYLRDKRSRCLTTPPTVYALLAENYWKMLLKIQHIACGLPVNAVFARYVRVSGFLSAFCPRGGKMRLYESLGGANMYP